MSKPISFETFMIVSALLQAKDNPTEIKAQLKGAYREYINLDTEDREFAELTWRKMTKSLFLGGSAFYNTTQPKKEADVLGAMGDIKLAMQEQWDEQKIKKDLH